MRGDIGGVAVPDGAVEEDHHPGIAAAQDFAGILCPRIGESIAWKTGPVVRCRNEACRSVLLAKGIDHEDEAQ